MGGDYQISYCKQLTSLSGCAQQVNHFTARGCEQLTSLEGRPTVVKGNYDISMTKISDLAGIAQKIGGGVSLQRCKNLTSLHGINPGFTNTINALRSDLLEVGSMPLNTKEIMLNWRPDMPVLKLLLSRTQVIWDASYRLGMRPEEWTAHIQTLDQFKQIFNRYQGRGANGVMPCAAELIKAGYRGNARL